jgi:hypothetical protein
MSKPQDLAQLEGLGKLNTFFSPRRVSNPRPSSLYHSALTTTVPHAPPSPHRTQLIIRIIIVVSFPCKSKRISPMNCVITRNRHILCYFHLELKQWSVWAGWWSKGWLFVFSALARLPLGSISCHTGEARIWTSPLTSTLPYVLCDA